MTRVPSFLSNSIGVGFNPLVSTCNSYCTDVIPGTYVYTYVHYEMYEYLLARVYPTIPLLFITRKCSFSRIHFTGSFAESSYENDKCVHRSLKLPDSMTSMITDGRDFLIDFHELYIYT